MARLDEQDLDEKRLERRQKRKKAELAAYITLVVLVILIAGIAVASVYLVSGVILNRSDKAAAQASEEISEEAEEAAVIESPEEETVVEEYTEEDMLDEIVGTVLSEMSVEDKVAGLFIVTPEQLTGVETAVKAGAGTQEALTSYAVGGITYSPKNIKSGEQISSMLGTTVSMSKYPLFTVMSSQSMESDQVREVIGITDETEITDAESAFEAGTAEGTALFKYGFNFAVAPLVDLSESGPYGTEPDKVKEITNSFAEGLKGSGVLACAYSFPMNGDSLTGMATNDKERDDIVVNEFEAFKAAFDSGNLQAVMVSNVSVPSLSGDNTPSSVSEKVITDELRGTLGFDGIIITSAFTDGAITEYYTSGEAAVEAIKAGADMVYIPENFSEAYEGGLAAVQSGSVSEARIDESLKRIFRVKYSDKVDQISQGN